jgi:hypothetical protein
LIFTLACQNLYGEEEGVGTVVGPEGVLAQAKGEGLIVADLDFDRLAFLRAEDEKIELPKRARPGIAAPRSAPPPARGIVIGRMRDIPIDLSKWFEKPIFISG